MCLTADMAWLEGQASSLQPSSAKGLLLHLQQQAPSSGPSAASRGFGVVWQVLQLG